MTSDTETEVGQVASTGRFETWEECDAVIRAKNRSENAFAQLVEQYEGRALHLAWKITSNHEDAEDVVQNAFAKAFQNLPGFRGDSRFYTWLARITINEALMKVRRRRYIEVSIDGTEETESSCVSADITDTQANPEQRYAQREVQLILAASINELEPQYREVFQLRDVEGLSTEETAQVLELTSAAVKTRLQRARIKLRNSLKDTFRSTRTVGNQSLGVEGCSTSAS